MHCVSTGTLGAFVAMAKFKSGAAKVILPAIGLGIAMFIHAIWNASVSFESTAAIGFLFLFLTVLIFIIIFHFQLKTKGKLFTLNCFPKRAAA